MSLMKGKIAIFNHKGKRFVDIDDLVNEIEVPEGVKGEKGDKGDDGVTQDATTITFTGLATDTATPVVAADTLLVAVGKLQAQVTALETRIEALETP